MITLDSKNNKQKETPSDVFLTYQELAEFLKISKRHASNLVRLGKIRKFKLGNSTRFLRSEIIHDLKKGRDANMRKEVTI